MFCLFASLWMNGAEAATALVVDATFDRLVEVDTTTLAVIATEPLPGPYDFGDAAYDAATGVLYIVTTRPTSELWAFDTLTRTFELVGTLPLDDVFAAGFHEANGALYVIEQTTTDLYVVDPQTAQATFVARTGVLADGGYWDTARDAFVVNRVGTTTFYAVSAAGVASVVGIAGVAVSEGDFDRDPDTGDVFAWDWSYGHRVFDGQTWQQVGFTAMSFGSDALAVVDGGPMTPRFAGGGVCPGPMSVAIGGLTPGGRVTVARASALGAAAVPAGPCAGVVLGLQAPTAVGTFVVPPTGVLRVTPAFGPGLCNQRFQAIDLATCAVTNVWQP